MSEVVYAHLRGRMNRLEIFGRCFYGWRAGVILYGIWLVPGVVGYFIGSLK